MSMKTTFIALVVVAALGGGYYWYSSQMPAEEADTTEQQNTGSQSKLDINVVCESALAYMTFPDGDSAAKFVAECKAGEHPEVIERYKADQGYGDGAAI